MFLQTLKKGRIIPPKHWSPVTRQHPSRNAQRPHMDFHCCIHLKDRSNFLLEQADMLPDPEMQLDCEHK